mmetsp:Transcript_34524/g.50693  ORF Transcript_34524/g.50693 Transcript_34524/m.50693 type:complete len:118 (-) Transcript_34524:197-550(-)
MQLPANAYLYPKQTPNGKNRLDKVATPMNNFIPRRRITTLEAAVFPTIPARHITAIMLEKFNPSNFHSSVEYSCSTSPMNIGIVCSNIINASILICLPWLKSSFVQEKGASNIFLNV